MTDEDKAYMAEALEWALRYAAMGWHVFPPHSVNADKSCTCGDPACTDIGKHPRTKRGLKDASNDKAQIEEWFGPKAEMSNVGIVTGELSNVTVLDIDCGVGKVGAESWEEAIREDGEPPTLKAKTGGGGYHAVFHYNSALKTASNVLGKNVDCRNDGGYIVAPPSRHRSGNRYEWLNWGTPLCALPAHLSVRKETRGRPRKDDPTRRTSYGLKEVRRMLERIPADDRDMWRAVGIILGREFNRSEAAWELYVEWAAKWQGKKGRDHDKTMHEAFYEISQESAEKELSLGTIVKAALEHGWAPRTGDVLVEDLLYVVQTNSFLDRSTGNYWVSAGVDAAVSPVNVEGKAVKASDWLKRHALVTSLACDPTLAGDYLVGADYIDGALVPRQGRACFNQYRRSTIPLGDAACAGPFVDHCALVFNKPGDAKQVMDYLAHRVQHAGVKPRFALLVAGPMGIGKDTAISMSYPAIGHRNVQAIDPKDLNSGFNEYEAATIVIISETANPQEMSKWAFNERTKVLIAGNPDRTTINPKYGVKFSVKRFCGVIITTNHLASGIYIPPGDRRYDVIETATFAEMGLEDEGKRRDYFEALYDWFLKGGDRHVAAFLHERDLSGFSPDHGQRKTAAHHMVVAANLEADSWLLDILSELGEPPVVRADWIVQKALVCGDKEEAVVKKLGPAMERADYMKYRNPVRGDGRWYPEHKRGVTLYVKVGSPPPTVEELKALLGKKPV